MGNDDVFTVNDLKKHLSRDIQVQEEKIETFRSRIGLKGELPFHIFENCDEIFLATARLKVSVHMLTAASKNNASLSDCVSIAQREVMQHAYNGTTSTSATRNLSARMLARAWAEFFEKYEAEAKRQQAGIENEE